MKKAQQRDLFPGALEMMILRTLKLQPLHGYALVQHIKRTSNDLLQIEEGSLYPALQRLLKEELVKAEWAVSSTNRRVRIYTLTPAGAKHLQREVSSFEKMLEGITGSSSSLPVAASITIFPKRFGHILRKKSKNSLPAACPEKKLPPPLAANLAM